MAEPQNQRPVSAGKYWRHFRVGDPVVTPLAEWAYVTPRFPEGIGQSALQNASPEVQRETAFVWFSLNFEPYALGEGPYFGFAGTSGALNTAPLNTAAVNAAPVKIAGFGQGVWAPTPLDAAAVLSAEFGVVLPDSVIAEVARSLPGRWMWRQRPALPPVQPAEMPTDRVELGAIILARLDALDEAIRDLRPTLGEIGHNRPPEGFGLTPEDEHEAQAAISRARSALSSEGETSGAELQAAAGTLKPVEAKFREQALGMLVILGTEFAKGVAQGAGKAFVKWLLAHEHIHELIALLEHAARLAGHH